jgi:transcriptional regulator with XRE-family HTH domain
MDAALLVRSARESADLSVRGLAARADVAASTVSRIEAGSIDPTLGTLTRLLTAAGKDIEVVTTDVDGPKLADLVDAWTEDPGGATRPDWTRMRAWLDRIARHPETAATAILGAPRPSGSALVDNLLAGIAEQLSDDIGLLPPPWTRRVPPLLEPWETPGTPRIRAVARAATPAPFAERNITLAGSSLWRDWPLTLG